MVSIRAAGTVVEAKPHGKRVNMYYDRLITLVAIAEGKNVYGEIEATEITTQVWAGRKSVTRAEFYAAQTEAMKPTRIYLLWTRDYAGQDILVDGTDRYKVIKSYETGEHTELTVAQGVRV